MAEYSLIERAQITVAHKAAGLIMAKTRLRSEYQQFVVTVTAVQDLAPRLRRITLTAPEFGSFEVSGPDEYFGLLLPGEGSGPVELPSAQRINLRAAVNAMPPERRPVSRWYTVRSLRAEAGEIDVDVVLHGDSGPASAWALGVTVGDRVGFRASGSGYNPAPGADRQLLIADETSAPALSAILDSPHRPADVTALLVTDDDDTHEHHADVDVLIARRDDAVAAAQRRLDGLSTPDYVWLCGESGLVTGLRRWLVKERGVDRRSVMFSGYWRTGKAENR